MSEITTGMIEAAARAFYNGAGVLTNWNKLVKHSADVADNYRRAMRHALTAALAAAPSDDDALKWVAKWHKAIREAESMAFDANWEDYVASLEVIGNELARRLAAAPTQNEGGDVERVALAICEGAGDSWEDLTETERDWHYRDARSAIAAVAALAAPAPAEPEKGYTVELGGQVFTQAQWEAVQTYCEGTSAEAVQPVSDPDKSTEPSEDELFNPVYDIITDVLDEYTDMGVRHEVAVEIIDRVRKAGAWPDEPSEGERESDMRPDEAAMVAVKKALSMFLDERQIILTVGQMQSRGVLFRMRDRSEPGEAEREAVTMRRFHKSYPGMPDLWHTSCEDHPDWGTCAEKDQAEQDVDAHMKSEHSAPVSRDAELIVEAKRFADYRERDGQHNAATLVRRLVEHIEAVTK